MSPLVAIVLLGISGLLLLTHLGRPERVLKAFSNPTAGITQEGVTMMAFGALVFMTVGMAIACYAFYATI